MGYLNELLRKIESFDPDDFVATVEAESTDDLEEIQRDQLMHGLNARGEKIGMYRNEHYAIYKHGLNPLPGFPFADLRKTGVLHNSIVANIVGSELIMEFTDSQAEEKTEGWNDPLLGLSGDFRNRHIAENIRPVFKSIINKRLGLRFE